jgi:uncharacterized protein (TIGR02246 family)
MRKLHVIWLLVISICSTAYAGPKEDALQVVERWGKAFTEADVDTIVGLYSSNAVFMGTGSKTIVTNPEDIKKYFQAALLGNRRFVATIVDSNVTVISDTAVVVTALDKLAVTMDGKKEDVFGRLTFVVTKTDSGWKIISFHRSAMPS